MNNVNEYVCEMISYLSKSFDVYLYINSFTCIDPIIFSNLYPIHGYCTGFKNESNGILEMITYINDMSSYYSSYIPYVPDEDEIRYVTDNYCEFMSKGLLSSKSVFESVNKSHEFKLKLSNRPWWKKLFSLGAPYGINSTHEVKSGCILLYNDLNKFNYLNKEYTDTFDSIRELVASSFNELGMDHLDISLYDL